MSSSSIPVICGKFIVYVLERSNLGLHVSDKINGQHLNSSTARVVLRLVNYHERVLIVFNIGIYLE